MKSNKPKLGSARMKELGYELVQVWLYPGRKARLVQLAADLGVPMATLARCMIHYFCDGGIPPCRLALERHRG